MNNKHNNQEEDIIALIDEHFVDGSFSATGTNDGEYGEVFKLLSKSHVATKPEKYELKQLLDSLPEAKEIQPAASLGEAMRSPYQGGINWLYRELSNKKFAATLTVMLLVVVAVGSMPKQGNAPIVATEVIPDEVIQPLAADIQPVEGNATFAMTEVVQPTNPEPTIMMSKMAQTTLADSTPQNVGELIALISTEADGDIGLGALDAQDPLLSVDQGDVNAIALSYDPQTI